MQGPYRDNLEHLQDELAWLDGVIRAAVARERAARDGTGGAFVSEETVDRLTGDTTAEGVPSADAEALLDQSAGRRAEISARASLQAGVELALPRIARLFGLSPFETDVLLVCFAPELDLKYERLYGYLHDDATRRAPSVELVLKLLCHTHEERLLAREAFLPSARLARFLLVEVRPGEEGRPLPARVLRLDERLAHALAGGTALDGRLASAARLIAPPPPARDGSVRPPLLAALDQYLAAPRSEQWLALLHGPDEAGQRDAAQGWCAAAGLPLLAVDLAVLAEADLPFERAVRLVLREAALQSAAVRLDHAEVLQAEADRSSARGRALEAGLLDLGWITFLTGTVAWDAPDTLKRHWVFVQEYALPPYRERVQLWESSLNGHGSEGLVLDELAAQFRFTRREIGNAIHVARSLARQRGDASAVVSQDDLRTACRAESNRGLVRFARRVATEYQWDDLVLPAEQKRQLQEIAEYVRHREAIYSDWGFARRHALGKGTNVLFSGPSGTGKTMAAGIIAADLGLELYKIDLSTVVSKYIGETEKNLHRVFHEAETANAILFFDEADALFGRRSEVKDSHDRYANIEVNYLLQKMEEHEGTVFLATNMSKSMDDAFLRRLHFTVIFPFPDQEERLRIWRHVFPTEAPVGLDVRFDFLARRLKVAGGNIKNIAVGAAFLARTEGTSIGMPQLIHAARREFQKMGKVYVKADFGEYHELVT